MKLSVSLLLTGVVLAGCAGGPLGASPQMTVAEAHPITVDQQTYALRVETDGTRGGLSRAALADIDGFVSVYRTKGRGPITVTAPIGTGSDAISQQIASHVRTALFAAGIPYEAMRGASVTGGGDVIASFQTFVATGPACGGGDMSAWRRMSGKRSEQFGCASQANLAAMIADPRDLHVSGVADGSGDAEQVSAVRARSERQSEQVTYQAEAASE